MHNFALHSFHISKCRIPSVLLTLMLSLLAACILSSSAQAQNAIGLTTFPAINEIAAEPGKSYTTEITIQNTADQASAIASEVRQLLPIDTELDESRRDEFDASSWITIDTNELLLAPNGVRTITATIDVPGEANPGGHYAEIGFKVLTLRDESESSGAQIVPEIVSSIFITVAGDIEEIATITASPPPAYIERGTDLELSFTIQNEGNVHILPSPSAVIRNGDEVIDRISFNPQIVLPNTLKQFTTSWSTADRDYGNYTVQYVTTYGSNSTGLSSDNLPFRIGPASIALVLLGIAAVLALIVLIRIKKLPQVISALRGRVPITRTRLARDTNKEIDEPDDIESVKKIAESLESERSFTKRDR